MGQMLNLSANKKPKIIMVWIIGIGLVYLVTSGSSSRGGGLAGKPGGDLVGVPGNIVVGGVHGDAFQYELISGILEPIVWACCWCNCWRSSPTGGGRKPISPQKLLLPVVHELLAALSGIIQNWLNNGKSILKYQK